MAVSAVVRCPECGSSEYFRDGMRKLADGSEKQRYLCRLCGFRHSRPTSLNVQDNTKEASQISANLKAKNLADAQKIKICAEDEKLTAGTKGLLTQFYAYLEKEGFCGDSRYPNNIKRLAKYGADLRDPESVKKVIGAQKVKDGMKMQYVYAYSALAAMLELKWTPPKYRQEEIIPFIPYEAELDALICGAKSKRVSTFLQCMKETYGDPTEVLRIEWIDKDDKERTIKINHPVKNHLPRTLEVSPKLISMLNSLPQIGKRIFSMDYRSLASTYRRMRKRIATMQQNPRILSIEMRSFRHWGGTMIAHYTNGNVLTVKKLLGHKRVENSMKYIGMIDFKNDDFEVATATTPEEIQKLGIAGWVKYDEMTINGTQMHFYKKPKRFSKYA